MTRLARLCATAATAVLVATAASAQDTGLLLTMQIEKDGAVIAKPRLVTQIGVKAAIQKDQEIKLAVTPALADGKVELSMQLYLPTAQGLAIAATPRLITALGTPASIEFQAPGEPRYKISVVAARHAIGAPPPAEPPQPR